MGIEFEQQLQLLIAFNGFEADLKKSPCNLFDLCPLGIPNAAFSWTSLVFLPV